MQSAGWTPYDLSHTWTLGIAEEMAASQTTANRGDIPVLHGIRGLLALWVLLGHSLFLCGAYFPILSAPGVAVYAFMVMSGFLMALHFRLREAREPWDKRKTWLLFYIRRFFRIAPLYYVVLIVAFAFHHQYMTNYYHVQRLFPFFLNHPPTFVAPFSLTSLVLHFGFLFGLLPSTADNNILPDWSIGLEMQFYFLFPFMMLTLRRFGAFWSAFVSLMILVVARSVTPTFPQPSFLPLVITPFVVGIFMSEAWLQEDRLKSSALLVLAIFMSSVRLPFMFQAIPLAMIFLINFSSLYAEFGMTRIGSIAIEILGGRVGFFLGERSYSVYLIHMLVIVPLVSLLSANPWFVSESPGWRFAIVAPTMIVICYLLASLTLKVVENPGIDLGRRIVNRWRTPARPAPAVAGN